MKRKTIPDNNAPLFFLAGRHGESVHRTRWPNAMPRKGMGNPAAGRKKEKLGH